MAINKKLIHFNKREDFDKKSKATSANDTTVDILYSSIVFIKDTQEIWTHGKIYPAPYTKEELDAFLADKADVSTLNQYYNKTEVDTKIANAVTDSIDLSIYETIEGATSKYQPKGNYLTEHQDISGKVDKVTGKSLVADTEITKLEDLPNNTQLTNLINTAKAAGDNAQSGIDSHKSNKSNPHGVTKAQVGLGNVTNDAQVKRSEMGVANGVATLDAGGKVPASQLPSYVDDIVDVYATYQKSGTGVLSNIVLYSDAAKTKLVTGEAGKIYQNIKEGEPGYQFRWTGTVFSQTGASSLIIGEVAGTAFDGARGKTVETGLQTHKNDKDNPHKVTKTQVGLGKVDNTSDAEKPVSTAQAAAIAAAVEALDATVTSTNGTNVQVKVTETNGKITGVNITTDNTAKNSDLTAEVTRAKAAEAAIQTALDDHKDNKDKKHIPAGGHERQILAWESDGTAKWDDLSNMFTGLEELLAYGVEWDVTVADPHLTRIGNMSLHKTLPIQSQLKGCIAQGDKIIYWLDEDNWKYKKGGNPNKGETKQLARLDGYDGTVRVYCPDFYIKSKIIGNKRQVWLSAVKIDNTWTYQPAMLIDAYRSTVLTAIPQSMGYLATLKVNSAISVVNTATYCRGGRNASTYDQYLETDPCRTELGKPIANGQNRATIRQYAENAGNYVMSYDQYKNIMYWLYVVEYANFNSQEAFNAELTAEGYHQGGMGAGVTTINPQHWAYYNGLAPLTPCGYLNEIGNKSGIKPMVVVTPTTSGGNPTQSYTFQVPRWRGFDNPFGDIMTILDGIIIDADADNHPNNMNYVYTCQDADRFSDSLSDRYEKVGEEIHQDGYTKLFDLGDAAHIIPSVIGGNTTQYKCAYHSAGDTKLKLRVLVVGGSAGDANAGLGTFRSDNSGSTSLPNAGFRSVSFLPTYM